MTHYTSRCWETSYETRWRTEGKWDQFYLEGCDGMNAMNFMVCSYYRLIS